MKNLKLTFLVIPLFLSVSSHAGIFDWLHIGARYALTGELPDIEGRYRRSYRAPEFKSLKSLADHMRRKGVTAPDALEFIKAISMSSRADVYLSGLHRAINTSEGAYAVPSEFVLPNVPFTNDIQIMRGIAEAYDAKESNVLNVLATFLSSERSVGELKSVPDVQLTLMAITELDPSSIPVFRMIVANAELLKNPIYTNDVNEYVEKFYFAQDYSGVGEAEIKPFLDKGYQLSTFLYLLGAYIDIGAESLYETKNVETALRRINEIFSRSSGLFLHDDVNFIRRMLYGVRRSSSIMIDYISFVGIYRDVEFVNSILAEAATNEFPSTPELHRKRDYLFKMVHRNLLNSDVDVVTYAHIYKQFQEQVRVEYSRLAREFLRDAVTGLGTGLYADIEQKMAILYRDASETERARARTILGIYTPSDVVIYGSSFLGIKGADDSETTRPPKYLFRNCEDLVQ